MGRGHPSRKISSSSPDLFSSALLLSSLHPLLRAHAFRPQRDALGLLGDRLAHAQGLLRGRHRLRSCLRRDRPADRPVRPRPRADRRLRALVDHAARPLRSRGGRRSRPRRRRGHARRDALGHDRPDGRAPVRASGPVPGGREPRRNTRRPRVGHADRGDPRDGSSRKRRDERHGLREVLALRAARGRPRLERVVAVRKKDHRILFEREYRAISSSRSEGVPLALDDQGGSLELLEVRDAELVRPAGRMERITEADEAARRPLRRRPCSRCDRPSTSRR